MAKSENIYGLIKQNLKSRNARATKATPENDEKTKIGLICKKATLLVQHTFFTFICRCFAKLQRETSRNFLVML